MKIQTTRSVVRKNSWCKLPSGAKLMFPAALPSSIAAKGPLTPESVVCAQKMSKDGLLGCDKVTFIKQRLK
jgi:hypothetical protein